MSILCSLCVCFLVTIDCSKTNLTEESITPYLNYTYTTSSDYDFGDSPAMEILFPGGAKLKGI